jgi:hypothetical protein
MAMPETVGNALAWWSSAYADHRAIPATLLFLHVGGLMFAGGTAVATDRVVLQAARFDDGRRAALAALAASHRTVVPALAVVIGSGALLAASDVATFLGSPVFWTKMALIMLLLANGYGLRKAEHRASTPQGWRRLAVGSAASLTLWLLIVLLGTMLTVVA